MCWLAGNPCETNCDGHGDGHRYVTVRFLKSAKVLDDMSIDVNEKESAIRFVDNLADHVKADLFARVNWENIKDSPATAALQSRLRAETNKILNARYNLEKGARGDPFAVGVDPNARPDSLTGMQRQSSLRESASGKAFRSDVAAQCVPALLCDWFRVLA